VGVKVINAVADRRASAQCCKSDATERKWRPVFVIGCHRSGTNLLYDTLLSAGGFAVYRGYLPALRLLIRRFGSLENLHSRGQIVDKWIQSEGFARAGLQAGPLSSKLLAECRNEGDFVRIVMDEVARTQGVRRWAVYDPDGVLYLDQIKRDIADALFVHIVRDGRDVALSLVKMGGFRPFPWDRKPRGLLESACYWNWMVQKGRKHGAEFPRDYLEVRFEELVTEPRAVLARLENFLEHDLDYARIQERRLGRLRESNSAFRGDGDKEAQNPIKRWVKLPHQQLVTLENLIGPGLQQFGYPLGMDTKRRRVGLMGHCLALLYPYFLSAKLWFKSNTRTYFAAGPR
jgi:hypothetical protein